MVILQIFAHKLLRVEFPGSCNLENYSWKQSEYLWATLLHTLTLSCSEILVVNQCRVRIVLSFMSGDEDQIIILNPDLTLEKYEVK